MKWYGSDRIAVGSGPKTGLLLPDHCLSWSTDLRLHDVTGEPGVDSPETLGLASFKMVVHVSEVDGVYDPICPMFGRFNPNLGAPFCVHSSAGGSHSRGEIELADSDDRNQRLLLTSQSICQQA